MAGRQSKTLQPDQIARLTALRIAQRLSFPQLKLTMDAPFRWQTLKRALEGEPVWELNHKFLVEWIDAHCPQKPAPADGKTAAAGELISRSGD